MSRRELIVLNALASKAGRFAKDAESKGLGLHSVLTEWDSAQAMGVKKEAFDRINRLLDSSWPEEEEARALKAGARIICLGEEEFPDKISDCLQFPSALYVKGSLKLLSPSVAVVGTRHCSPYGIRIAKSLGKILAERSVTVISGGAMGIDGAAHSGALDGGGCTAAVLGTGIDIVYPTGHEELFSSIVSKGGCLISQFPVGSEGQAWHFPKRNGIIASLSAYVVVVESALKGGAMITASLAGEMGREVWAVPGPIDQEVSEGTNRLLFDGAQTLWNIEDFAAMVSGVSPEQVPLFKEAREDDPEILKALRERGKATIDDLAQRTGMTFQDAMVALVELEVEGKIYRSGPGRWSAVP